MKGPGEECKGRRADIASAVWVQLRMGCVRIAGMTTTFGIIHVCGKTGRDYFAGKIFLIVLKLGVCACTQ